MICYLIITSIIICGLWWVRKVVRFYWRLHPCLLPVKTLTHKQKRQRCRRKYKRWKQGQQSLREIAQKRKREAVWAGKAL